MSNRTTIELNHDYCPRDEELLEWAKAMQNYMHSGDRTLLPAGVTFEYMRHHSQPKREQGSWPRGGSTTEELRRAREFCLEAGSPCFGDLGEERVHAMLMEYDARSYSQGYKEALSAAAGIGESYLGEELTDEEYWMGGRNHREATTKYIESIRSLPIPEAK